MRYVSYLNPVIETNVTVERLAVFKKKYYDLAYTFRDRLAQMLSTTQANQHHSTSNGFLQGYERFPKNAVSVGRLRMKY